MPRTPLLVALMLLAAAHASAQTLEMREPVVMLAAAVAPTQSGFVGSTATISITSATNGSGHVFLDTFPLTEVDMQGSARLAARVASQLTGKDLHEHDFFFVVRSGSEQIGGPSAGATMTVGAIASLNGWKVRDDVLMTGTVNADATVGPVGGIAEKAAAAADVGVARFLFPAGEEIVPVGQRLVNMSEYCRDELDIECIPVVDVHQAVALMTDHAFERPPVTGNVTGAQFLERLGPLSEELVQEAQEIHDEAEAALAAVPAGAARAALAERLAEAGALLARAQNETANGTYYTAASVSFQSSIESHYVREASEYLAAADPPLAHAASIAEARAVVQRVAAEVARTPVEDTNSFETVGAAQVRIMEAEERLARAQLLARQPQSAEDVLLALYEAAYAAERADTAAWWLRLSQGFPKGEPVDPQALAEFARDTMTTSREEIAYIEAVFRSAGGSAQLLARSRELLEDAQAASERGFYAAAMLSALEASVRASVVLQITTYGGDVPESKLESAREVAARAIQGARARGVESLLAQSAYEFGLSLESDSERLSFLGLARVTANLAGLPGLFDESQPLASRFQGQLPTLRVAPVLVAAAFAVGLALGAGAGLSALMPRKEDDVAAPPEEPAEPAVPAWNVPPAMDSWEAAPAAGEERREEGAG